MPSSTSRVGARSWRALSNGAGVTCRAACRRRRTSLRTRLLTDERSSRAGVYCRPRDRLGHCPTTSHDDGRVQTDTSAGPAQPAPASSARLRLGQTTSRSWTQRATTPTPAIPAVRRPAPPPRCMTSLRPDTADAGTHGHRTPDTGQRTPGRSDARTGHWTPVAWTGTRGHWSLAPDTGRRTLAEDTDRVTKARPAAGPPGPPRRATARWDAQTMFLWTAPAVPLSPWRLGGEATFQREIALALPCSCLVAPPGPSGASAHCCPRTVRVEIGRKAHGQVLWRVH